MEVRARGVWAKPHEPEHLTLKLGFLFCGMGIDTFLSVLFWGIQEILYLKSYSPWILFQHCCSNCASYFCDVTIFARLYHPYKMVGIMPRDGRNMKSLSQPFPSFSKPKWVTFYVSSRLVVLCRHSLLVRHSTPECWGHLSKHSTTHKYETHRNRKSWTQAFRHIHWCLLRPQRKILCLWGTRTRTCMLGCGQGRD
jgi:hypothetical protein